MVEKYPQAWERVLRVNDQDYQVYGEVEPWGGPPPMYQARHGDLRAVGATPEEAIDHCAQAVLANMIQRVPPSPASEEYFFSFTGTPYTQIRAEVMSIKPLNSTERAIDVKFDNGKAVVRIIFELGKTTLVGFEPTISKDLYWKREYPTEEGWYWLTNPFGEPRIVEVRPSRFDGKLAVRDRLGVTYWDVKYHAWAGPIPMPVNEVPPPPLDLSEVEDENEEPEWLS